MLRNCIRCKLKKNTTEFYSKGYGNFLSSFCKSCWIAHVGKKHPQYSKTTRGKLAINKASNTARKKFPEKWKARSELRYAVKIGLIEKLKFCQVCEKMKPLQGHHENYKKPLEVLWLCTKCHANRHNQLKSKLKS